MSEEMIEPCPFCGIGVGLFDGDTLYHPDNDCLLAGDYLDLAKWNVRAASAYNPDERLREALKAIREVVSRRQLPITNEIYELADSALSPLPQGEDT